MRRVIALAALALPGVIVLGLAVLGGGAPARAADEGPGCGLGSMVFHGQSGVIPATLAATSNFSSGSQTFGISSGTSNCKRDAVILRQHEQQMFVAENLDPLSQELAQGGGERVAALAGLLGCPAALQGQFALAAQAGYGAIFSGASYGAVFPGAGSATPAAPAVLASLKRELAHAPALAAACTRLS